MSLATQHPGSFFRRQTPWRLPQQHQKPVLIISHVNRLKV